MARFDRYMLSQLLLIFGFFALVLVAVFWINRAVTLFDRLIGGGQSLWVFVEFTALGLPTLVLLVLPLAAFGAATYVTNRLNAESELTVMLATGTGPWRLARPVLVFALFVAFAMAMLSHILAPAAWAELNQREAEISRDATARLLTEGTFLHPTAGVTLYTRDIGEDGVLRGVFLSDRRDPNSRVIYTAATAYLVREDGETALIMVDGMAQRLRASDNRLAVGTFRDFSYDITDLVRRDPDEAPQARAISTLRLLRDGPALLADGRIRPGVLAEEIHSRMTQPLFGVVAAMLGFAMLMSRGYSRLGAWREIVLAFVILLMLDGLRAAMADTMRAQAALWPLAYLPSALGGILVLGFLAHAANPIRLRRRPRAAKAAA